MVSTLEFLRVLSYTTLYSSCPSMMFIPVLFPNSFKSRWFHCTIFSIRFFSRPSPHVLNPTRDGALARLTPWQLASYWDRKKKWSLISNTKFHIIQFVLIFQVIIPSSWVTNNVIHKLSLGLLYYNYIASLPKTTTKMLSVPSIFCEYFTPTHMLFLCRDLIRPCMPCVRELSCVRWLNLRNTPGSGEHLMRCCVCGKRWRWL